MKSRLVIGDFGTLALKGIFEATCAIHPPVLGMPLECHYKNQTRCFKQSSCLCFCVFFFSLGSRASYTAVRSHSTAYCYSFVCLSAMHNLPVKFISEIHELSLRREWNALK